VCQHLPLAGVEAIHCPLTPQTQSLHSSLDSGLINKQTNRKHILLCSSAEYWNNIKTGKDNTVSLFLLLSLPCSRSCCPQSSKGPAFWLLVRLTCSKKTGNMVRTEKIAGDGCSGGEGQVEVEVGMEADGKGLIECRICQEEGEENAMDSPCACAGTLKVRCSPVFLLPSSLLSLQTSF
jgi:hypothetical protein